jgi:hypothetical protein
VYISHIHVTCLALPSGGLFRSMHDQIKKHKCIVEESNTEYMLEKSEESDVHQTE